MNLDAQNRYLDQAERALKGAYGGRRHSETSFLQGLLRELGAGGSAGGLSPAGLFRAALHNGPLLHSAQDLLWVLAGPSQRPADSLRARDWMLRAVPGTGDVGHVSVLASDDLLTHSMLASEGIPAESGQPGYYGLVIEAGAFPHSRVRPFARRLLDSRGRVPPNTVLLRPRYSALGAMTNFPPNEPERNGVQGPVEQVLGLAGEDVLEYEQILERIRQELNLRFRDPNDPGLIKRRRRLRKLFTSVPGFRTKELHTRLGARPTGDELSGLFHGRLATATRRELLRILEDRFPADKAPDPSQPTPTTRESTCQRAMGSMTQLLPWERSLLALVHDKSEADFKGVAILIGPIILPGLMAWPLDAIVKMALKDNYAITIESNIWFPRAIDTSTVDDFAWLVHESLHVVDYAVAGTEAFLKTYIQQAVVHGFKHDDIPHERRANRIETAAKGMLARFPDLVSAIGSCDSSAILALLERQKDAYRAALNESIGEGKEEVDQRLAERNAAEFWSEPSSSNFPNIFPGSRGTSEVGVTVPPDSISEAKRPDLGRIYEFVRDLLKLPSTDSSGFKKILASCFRPKVAACGKEDSPAKGKGCSYAALIVGEWSHDEKGEQDLALKMIDHVAAPFPSRTFALYEETVGTGEGSLGRGILTGGLAATAATAVTKRRGISVTGLPDGDQFRSERWVPSAVKRSAKLITYTGSAHTSQEYSDYFKKALPRVFDMSAGKPILDSVRDANRRGLVLVVNLADEILEDFEIQAHREKLREFPEAWMFENWLAVLNFDWTALFSSFKATTLYKLAEDVYWALVPPYSGLRFDRTLEIAWSDPRVSDRIRGDKSWTLYDISKNKLRFEDDHKKGKHFLSVEVDVDKKGLVRGPTEENY